MHNARAVSDNMQQTPHQDLRLVNIVSIRAYLPSEFANIFVYFVQPCLQTVKKRNRQRNGQLTGEI